MFSPPSFLMLTSIMITIFFTVFRPTFHKVCEYAGDVRRFVVVDALHHFEDAVFLRDFGQTTLWGQMGRKHALHNHRGLKIKHMLHNHCGLKVKHMLHNHHGLKVKHMLHNHCGLKLVKGKTHTPQFLWSES